MTNPSTYQTNGASGLRQEVTPEPGGTAALARILSLSLSELESLAQEIPSAARPIEIQAEIDFSGKSLHEFVQETEETSSDERRRSANDLSVG